MGKRAEWFTEMKGISAMSRFVDVVVSEKPDVTVSYRSGLMVYEEGLREGRWVSLS